MMTCTDQELDTLNRGRCPDCSYRGFVLGPRGGASTNIECGNFECRARFNVASAPGSHHLVYAHRIVRQSEGGADWSK